jgi:hypothetical protein
MSLATIRITRFEQKIKNLLQDVLANLEESKADKRDTTLLSNEELEALWAFAVQGWSRQVSRCEAETMKEMISAHRQRW